MAAGHGVVIAATDGFRGVGDESGNNGEKGLVALDARGVVLWRRNFAGSPAYNILVDILLCPADGEVAVFSSDVGTVYKLRLWTGERIWTMPGPTNAAFTTSGSIVGPDGTIFTTAVVATINATLAQEPTNGPGAQSARGVVRARHLTSGRLKWEVDLGAPNTQANNAPSVGRLGGPASPLAVVIAVGPNPTPSPADIIFGSHNKSGQREPAKTIALDAATGQIIWTYTMPLWHGGAAGDSLAHPCLPDSSANIAIDGAGIVYVPHEDGAVYAIRDDDGDGVIGEGEVASYQLNMTLQSAPAIAPGLLVVAPCDGLAVWVAGGLLSASAR